jgi:hypothetical protein
MYVNKKKPGDFELIFPKYLNEQILTSLSSEEKNSIHFLKGGPLFKVNRSRH